MRLKEGRHLPTSCLADINVCVNHESPERSCYTACSSLGCVGGTFTLPKKVPGNAYDVGSWTSPTRKF